MLTFAGNAARLYEQTRCSPSESHFLVPSCFFFLFALSLSPVSFLPHFHHVGYCSWSQKRIHCHETSETSSTIQKKGSKNSFIHDPHSAFDLPLSTYSLPSLHAFGFRFPTFHFLFSRSFTHLCLFSCVLSFPFPFPFPFFSLFLSLFLFPFPFSCPCPCLWMCAYGCVLVCVFVCFFFLFFFQGLADRVKLIRGVIREVTGYAAYEKRIMEILKGGGNNPSKRAWKFAKGRLGTHIRAKRKVSEMGYVIEQSKKAEAAAKAAKAAADKK